ncbi:MAG: hypothetical protein ACYS1C_02815 [Planctomycetota bacterium]|jgi:hypothetical protein
MSQPLFGLTVGTQDAADRARRFNVDFVDLHFRDRVDLLPPALDACDGAGLKYVLNFEGAPIGWVPPDRLRPDLERRPGFLGFMLDEADHMQLNAHWPVIAYYGYGGRHFLAETEGMDLVAARGAVLAALRERNEACTVAGTPAAVEFLFPAMMHTAARAGLTVSPKVLKETCGPAMLAVAMGAARQYGVDFWVDVDYWWHNEAIGHTPERFRSALELAYWSGASRIYVEGGARHSDGHPVGRQIEAAYAEFIEQYVPAHPRPFSWRDFRPQTAIIRFDDTCFDERQKHLGEYPGPLYGHVAAGAQNAEWLNVWSLLSHGFVRTDSVSHQWEARRFGCRTLFVPLHNVAVYDHEVSYEVLAGLRLIFLSGVMISSGTLEAVARCVREGAVCVLPPRLAPAGSELAEAQEAVVVEDAAGRWVVAPEFYRLHYECFCGGPALAVLREALAGLAGDGDHLVYDFGDWTVRIGQAGGDYPRHEIMTCRVPVTQAGANPDRLEVELQESPA